MIYQWFYNVTNLEVNSVVVAWVFIWPSIIFLLFLYYLKQAKHKSSIRNLAVFYICLAGLFPIIWMLLSALIHKQGFDVLSMAIIIVPVVVLFWPGMLAKIILKYYLGKDEFAKLMSIDNANVVKVYPRSKFPLYLFAYCFLGTLLLILLVVIMFISIPYLNNHYHTASLNFVFIIGIIMLINFCLRWLIRCPLCNLAIYDYKRNDPDGAAQFFYSTFLVIFRNKIKCSNCRATFLLKNEQ